MPRIKELPVLFRAERSGRFRGDVTAVFPTIAADYAGREFTVYAHIGQHGGGTLPWYRDRTRAARPDEFADLLQELRSIYESGPDPVRLVVRHRFSAGYRQAWQADAKAARDLLRADPSGGPWTPSDEGESV